jgi:hypothetical protein
MTICTTLQVNGHGLCMALQKHSYAWNRQRLENAWAWLCKCMGTSSMDFKFGSTVVEDFSTASRDFGHGQAIIEEYHMKCIVNALHMFRHGIAHS